MFTKCFMNQFVELSGRGLNYWALQIARIIIIRLLDWFLDLIHSIDKFVKTFNNSSVFLRNFYFFILLLFFFVF